MNNIRKLVLAGKTNQIKKILLTPAQLSLLKSIKGEITSREAGIDLCISTQNAGQRLQWIERKGYLVSREELDPTGGYYLIYTKVDL